MLKKPLFWIIVIIILAILWFIFMGRRKLNQPTPVPTTPQNASIKLPLKNDPDMPVIVKNEHASKESIAKQTIIAEQQTLNLDNNHGVNMPKTNDDTYDDQADADDDDEEDTMASNSDQQVSVSATQIKNAISGENPNKTNPSLKTNKATPVAEPMDSPTATNQGNNGTRPQEQQPPQEDPIDPFEQPTKPSAPLRQQPGPVDQPHSISPFQQEQDPEPEQDPFSEPPKNPPSNNDSPQNNQNLSSSQAKSIASSNASASTSASSPSEPGEFNH